MSVREHCRRIHFLFVWYCFFFFFISCFNLLKCLVLKSSFLYCFSISWYFEKGGLFWWASIFWIFFFFLYLLFNLKPSFSISRTVMNDEKESLFYRSRVKMWLLWFPLVRVLAQVLFSIKEIASKKIPIRYFEFNYIFTKRDCYVVNLQHVWNYCTYVFKLSDDVKEISRGCIYFIAEW